MNKVVITPIIVHGACTHLAFLHSKFNGGYRIIILSLARQFDRPHHTRYEVLHLSLHVMQPRASYNHGCCDCSHLIMRTWDRSSLRPLIGQTVHHQAIEVLDPSFAYDVSTNTSQDRSLWSQTICSSIGCDWWGRSSGTEQVFSEGKPGKRDYCG